MDKPLPADPACRPHLYWLDLLKLIAIFMMVAGHCGDFVPQAERASDWYQVWGTVYNSLMRPAIPLFVMITGALLLPVKQTASAFYAKRLPRVLIPFALWALFYALFPLLTRLLGFPPSTVTDFFPWAPADQSGTAALFYIAEIPFDFSPFCVQMWYIYTLIGIYLYLPIFSAWVKQATDKEQRLFLGLWGLTLFIPYLRELPQLAVAVLGENHALIPYFKDFLGTKLWGVCSWNEFGMLYCFAGFNGYLLLGHYLKNHPFAGSWAKLLALCLPMFAVGYAATLIGFKHMVSLPGAIEPMIELFFTYCSPNVFLMTLPLALIAQKVNYTNVTFRRLMVSLSSCTFGIWMIHYFCLYPCKRLVDLLQLHTMVSLVVTSVFLLAVNWLLVAAVRRIPNVGTKIMG